MTTIYPERGYAPNLVAACDRHGLLRNQAAYVLATSQWETAHTHEPVKEAYWLSEEWREQNLRYYPWYGRGFVQLTWEENYERAQNELGLGTQLTDNPDRALDPDIAENVIVVGMEQGWFTGKKLSDYITLQASDFHNARRIVNGTDSAAEIAALATEYDHYLLSIGYGVEEPDQPVDPLPDLPDDIKERLVAFAHYIDQLEARIAELERWRKS